jgi:hypothetical protein
MSLDEEDDIPRSEIWDKGVILFAALLTACAIGVCFFQFTIPAAKPGKAVQAAGPSAEVMVGVGRGSNIHQKPAP